MDDRKALMLAWLEEEGERQRRPVRPLPQANDPAIRGWVQVGVCGLGGALVFALLVCWLLTARQRAARIACMDKLRSMAFLNIAGEPNALKFGSDGSSGKGTSDRTNVVPLGIVLCLVVLTIAVATVIRAVFFRIACGFYNKLIGGKASPRSVPEPLFGKAMAIILATTIINVIAGLALGLRFGKGATVLPQLLFPPISLFVMAGVNCALLPTTFGRGRLVALCYLLVLLFVIVVLGGQVLLISLPG